MITSAVSLSVISSGLTDLTGLTGVGDALPKQRRKTDLLYYCEKFKHFSSL